MAKIDTLGTLTIAAGTSMSAAMSKSFYDNYDALAVFPSVGMPAASGSATLFATFETQSYVSASVSSSNPFAGAVNVNHWFLVNNTAGTEVVIDSASVATIASFPFENIVLISDSKPANAIIYTVQGQQQVAITGLAALNNDAA